LKPYSSTYRIPLPFVTAAIALWLDFVFPINWGPIVTTAAGFLVGVLLLYLYFVVQRSPSVTKDPPSLLQGKFIER